MSLLVWSETPYRWAAGTQYKSTYKHVDFISIIPPCDFSFGSWELYIPALLEDIERFDTLEEAQARAEEVCGAI